MPKWFLPMFAGVVLIPIGATAIKILFDYFSGEFLSFSYYVPTLLGFATGGIIIGFTLYQVRKLNDKEKQSQD